MKQAGYLWNRTLNEYLLSVNFTRCTADPCVYLRRDGDRFIVIGTYVRLLPERSWLASTVTLLAGSGTGISWRDAPRIPPGRSRMNSADRVAIPIRGF